MAAWVGVREALSEIASVGEDRGLGRIAAALDAVVGEEVEKLRERAEEAAAEELLGEERVAARKIGVEMVRRRSADDEEAETLEKAEELMYVARDGAAYAQYLSASQDSFSRGRLAAYAHRRSYAERAPPNWHPGDDIAPQAPPYPRVAPGERAAARILSDSRLLDFDANKWFGISVPDVPAAGKKRPREAIEESDEDVIAQLQQELATLPQELVKAVQKKMRKQKKQGWIYGQPLNLPPGWLEEICNGTPPEPIQALVAHAEGKPPPKRPRN